jgi:hypothetical protein
MADTPMTGQALAQRAVDELAIMRTTARVARAQDDRDPVAYRKCFTDSVFLHEAVIIPNWTPQEISADELTRLTMESLGKLDIVHHMVFNHVIQVDGEEATCEADLFGVSGLIEGETTSTSQLGGRYVLRLQRHGGEWLIRERSIRRRYGFGDPTLRARADARAQAAKAAAGS